MNLTSIQNTAAINRNRRAMTLLEILVTVAIATVLFAMIGTLAVSTTRSFVALGNYGDLDRASRNALDILSRDVRQSRALTNYTSTKITLVANDYSLLTYNYNPSTGDFTRQSGSATPTVLLTECDYLNFKISQRNPSNNWTWYPVTSNQISTTKLIDVGWKCSRKILGQKVNTESVQTAKIVIRN